MAVAMAWGSGAMKTAKQRFPDCSLCHDANANTQEFRRRQWGCDEPSPYGRVFSISCRCIHDRECKRCGGTGEVWFKQCPSAVMRDSENIIAALEVSRSLEFYREYDARQQLPATGGWGDQSVWFSRLCSIIDVERGRWEKKRDDIIEKARPPS